MRPFLSMPSSMYGLLAAPSLAASTSLLGGGGGPSSCCDTFVRVEVLARAGKRSLSAAECEPSLCVSFRGLELSRRGVARGDAGSGAGRSGMAVSS